jgi:acyl-CoA dehydrogenase
MTSHQLTRYQTELQAEFRDLAKRCFRPFGIAADQLAGIPPGFLEQPEIAALARALMPLDQGGGWVDTKGERHDLASPMLCSVFNEEIGYGDAPLLTALPGLSLAMPILMAYGTQEQQERFLAPFQRPGKHSWAAFAMSEPSAGSDVSALSTRVRIENGGYVLNGTKWFVGNGLRADWVMVFATTNPRLGRFGIKVFIVERGTPGFEAQCVLPSLGFRVLQLSQLRFNECWIPESNILTPRGSRHSFDGGIMTFSYFRPAIAALAVGTARAALELACEVTHQNGTNHGTARRWRQVSEQIESLKIRLHAARLLCRNIGWTMIGGKNAFSQTCMAKAFCARIVMEICTFAMDVAGLAAGNTLPFEKLFRDAKAFDLLEGTGDMQRLMLCRQLLKEGTSQ